MNITTKHHLKAAKSLALLLDNQFKIAGIEFGLDPLLDIIPGLGDVIGAILSLYIVWIARELQVPGNLIWKMLRNILIDFLIGLVPIAGVVGDLLYKSNKMNIEIIEKFLGSVVEGKIISS